MEANAKRKGGMKAILVYLEAEFRDYDVSQLSEWQIKVRDTSAKTVHEVNFYPEFLDDHADREVAKLKEWGLVALMKKVGDVPVWVASKGLPT